MKNKKILSTILLCCTVATAALANDVPTKCMNINQIQNNPYWRAYEVSKSGGDYFIDSVYNNPAEDQHWNRFDIAFPDKGQKNPVAYAQTILNDMQLSTQPAISHRDISAHQHFAVCNYAFSNGITIAMYSCTYDDNGKCIQA